MTFNCAIFFFSKIICNSLEHTVWANLQENTWTIFWFVFSVQTKHVFPFPVISCKFCVLHLNVVFCKVFLCFPVCVYMFFLISVFIFISIVHAWPSSSANFSLPLQFSVTFCHYWHQQNPPHMNRPHNFYRH